MVKLEAVMAALLDRPADVSAPASEIEPIDSEPETLSDDVVIDVALTAPVAVRPPAVSAPFTLTAPVV